MRNFQDIQPKRAGLRCEVQVCNHQGHGILTTYDPAVDNSVELAQNELEKFWDDCIAKYGKPTIAGRKVGMPEGQTDWLDVKDPEFDLSLYEQVTVVPFPLVGG